MTTANSIINKAMRSIGVIAPGDAGTGAEYQDALESLNSIIDAWSVSPEFYFTELYEPFALTAARAGYIIGNTLVPIASLTSVTTTASAVTSAPHQLETGDKVTISGATEANYNVTASVTVTGPKSYTYTITATTSPATGAPVFTSGDFLTARPIRILSAFTRAAGIDSQIGIVTESYWSKIPSKSAAAAIPVKLLYRPTYPFGRVMLYPVQSGTPTLYITSEKIITAFPDLVTEMPLPPGYQKMLELALAVDLTAEYGAKVTETVATQVKESYAMVLKANREKFITSKLQVVPNGGSA